MLPFDIVLLSLVIDTDMKIYEVSRPITLRKYRHSSAFMFFDNINYTPHQNIELVLTVNDVILTRTIYVLSNLLIVLVGNQDLPSSSLAIIRD